MSGDPMSDFIDLCCRRYVKQPSYRRTLERERPKHTTEAQRLAARTRKATT
jgi:hypothetical protein